MKKQVLLLLSVGILCINMGTAEREGTLPEPYHTNLENDQKSYIATIYENGEATKVKDLNFSGLTKLEPIQQEDSTKAKIVVELSNTAELELANPHFVRDEKEYCLVNRKTINGNMDYNLMFPKNLIISGIRSRDNTKIFWRIRSISKIIINHL